MCLIDETGKHKPIFIEIWSKHKNSEKKAESDYRIIEIRLRTTADLEELPKHPITESENVTFSHFMIREREPEATDGPKLMKYTLYADTLKSFVDTKSVSCSNYKDHHRKALLEIVGMSSDAYSIFSFWKYCNAVAIDKGYDIRSCYICRLYGEDKSAIVFDSLTGTYTNPELGCRRDFERQGILPCKSDDARTCDSFSLKDRSIQGSLKAYSKASIYIWERHPDGTESEEYREGKEEDSTPASFYDPGYLV